MGKCSKYGVLTKAGDKLYEITFDEYAKDYPAAIEYFTKKYKQGAQACTSIYKDGIFMLNLDRYLKSYGLYNFQNLIM